MAMKHSSQSVEGNSLTCGCNDRAGSLPPPVLMSTCPLMGRCNPIYSWNAKWMFCKKNKQKKHWYYIDQSVPTLWRTGKNYLFFSPSNLDSKVHLKPVSLNIFFALQSGFTHSAHSSPIWRDESLLFLKDKDNSGYYISSSHLFIYYLYLFFSLQYRQKRDLAAVHSALLFFSFIHPVVFYRARFR